MGRAGLQAVPQDPVLGEPHDPGHPGGKGGTRRAFRPEPGLGARPGEPGGIDRAPRKTCCVGSVGLLPSLYRQATPAESRTMKTTTRTAPVCLTPVDVIPMIASSTVDRRDPEDGEMVTRAVHWVYVEIDGARYDHYKILDSYEAAESLAERVFRANLPASHFTTSAHWSLYTDPYAGDLDPYGPAWQDEQRERLAA